ncbi:MAG: hypothetical protein AAGA35_00515 [Patescibacteria group bacterium]
MLAVTNAGALVPSETAYGHITTTDDRTEIRLVGEDTETIVRHYFQDIPVMIQVARCESTFRHELEDGSILQGHVDNDDTGVMQINKRYHEARSIELGLDIHDIYDNMAYARYLYEKQGTQPWNASRPCWGQTLAMNI